MSAYKKDQLLEATFGDLTNYGDTFAYTELGREFMVTRDPANYKALLTANVTTMGVQQFRGIPCLLLFERSFFSNDGPAWKKSRVDLKPALSKQEYVQLHL